jgi:RHS repeat-associated protein
MESGVEFGCNTPSGSEWTTDVLGTDQKLRFTGHDRDLMNPTHTTDDLDWMHARHYNFNLGRFLSVDPAPADPMRPQSWNAYAYVLNNPIKFTYPFGWWEADDMRIWCYGGAGGDTGCGSTIRRLLDAQNWIRGRAVENLGILTPPNLHLTTSVAIGSMATKGFGVEGLTYLSVETTDMKEDRFTLEIQPYLAGVFLGYKQKGLNLLDFEVTDFGLKMLVFNKTLFSQELGWGWDNEGSVGSSIAFWGSIGWSLNLNEFMQRQYADQYFAIQYILTGDSFWIE